jgi:hypothetical protein
VALTLKRPKGSITIPSLECCAEAGKIVRQDFFTNIDFNTLNLIKFQFNYYFYITNLINPQHTLYFVNISRADSPQNPRGQRVKQIGPPPGFDGNGRRP